MKLAVFNGSPRAKGSNTKLLMERFMQAIEDHNDKGHWEWSVAYLAEDKKRSNHVTMFREADYVILAFPLYTDAMPAMVKTFIEDLLPLCGKGKNPPLGCVVQSGLPETHHSRCVERYLQGLAKRLGSPYLGTIIKGGVEGVQVKPPWMTKKLFAAFYQLGMHFAKTKTFDKKIIKRLANRENLSPIAQMIYRLLGKTGLANFYWNSQLKKNKAFKERFARPYQKG